MLQASIQAMRIPFLAALVLAVILTCIPVPDAAAALGGGEGRQSRISSSLVSRSSTPPDSVNEAESIPYAQIVREHGVLTKAAKRYRLGVILKYLGNPFYQRMADGMQAKAAELGLFIDVQAGLTESDHEGQRAIMEDAIGRGYDALLVAPQTGANLKKAARNARGRNILVIDVDGALSRDADHYIGPDHYQSGVLAARFFRERIGRSGKLAVLNGLEQDFSADRRNQGLMEALREAPLQVIAQATCFWDFQTAMLNSAQLLRERPDLDGFFGNSDIMALGAAQAVRQAGRSGEVVVLGRDGIDLALEDVQSGRMAGTIDVFPYEQGQAAVDIAVRVLGGQSLPRNITTRQQLVTGGKVMGADPLQ